MNVLEMYQRPNFGENENSSMKEFLEDIPHSELKKVSKREEKNNGYQIQQYNNKAKTISPERVYSPKNFPQKEKQNPSTKQIQSEKLDKNNSFELALCRLRPHIINLISIFDSLSITLNILDPIKKNLLIEKIEEAINILYNNIMLKCHSSELVSILSEIEYLCSLKQDLKYVEKNIEFSKIDNDWKNNVIKKSNTFENKIKFSVTKTQEIKSKKKDMTFLNKKRFYTTKIEKENKIKTNQEVITNGNDKNNLFKIQNTKNKALGRIPKHLKERGIKGKKDDTDPENGLNKILRHCLENLVNLLNDIIQKLDKNIKISNPGINKNDLKNNTRKENYIKKSIKEILCKYTSKEKKDQELIENEKKINRLLQKDFPGQEEVKKLLKKILEMSLEEGLEQYLNKTNSFLTGNTIKTFSDDFSNFDSKVQKTFKDKADDLIKGKIQKREKSKKNYSK